MYGNGKDTDRFDEKEITRKAAIKLEKKKESI